MARNQQQRTKFVNDPHPALVQSATVTRSFLRGLCKKAAHQAHHVMAVVKDGYGTIDLGVTKVHVMKPGQPDPPRGIQQDGKPSQ